MSIHHTAYPHDLSLRDRLAQLLFVRIGSNLPPVRTVEADVDRVARLLDEYALGGLILFNGIKDSTPGSLEALQQRSRYPLLIGADIERGVGQQVRGYTLFPHAMAFGALGDDAEQTVYDFARLTAISAREHGIHITFAPLADVNLEPRNPIIATRAFGGEPEQVARLVRAFIKGSDDGGILATAKHFPGHGRTFLDSHHTLPVVANSRAELSDCDLLPFRSAIEARVPLIMTAHVQYPNLDGSGLPATLSRAILVDLLRNEMGFAGAVVSDSLLMEAVKSQPIDEGELVLRALLAGVDVQLDVEDVEHVLAALERAVDDGRLSVERVNQAFGRVAELKNRVFAPQITDSTPSLAEVMTETQTLAQSVARRAITVVSSRTALLPLATDQSLLVIMLRPHKSNLDPDVLPFGGFMHARFPSCRYVEIGPQATSQEYRTAVDLAMAHQQVVIGMVVKPAAWHRFGLMPEQDSLVHNLTRSRDCVVISLGTPAALERYDAAAASICSYSDVFVSQMAVADFLATKMVSTK